jgi:hypothetical protein
VAPQSSNASSLVVLCHMFTVKEIVIEFFCVLYMLATTARVLATSKLRQTKNPGPCCRHPGILSRFPLALSQRMRRTRSCTSCEGMHVTSSVNTRQTPRDLTGIRTMKITAWQSDAWSSRDRRGSGRRGLSKCSGCVDIAWTSIRDADSWDEGS